MQKKLAKLFTAFSKNWKKEYFAYLGIFFLALFLRLYRLESYVSFFDDAGRDALVSKNIFKSESESIFISPAADGGMNQLHNSPFYFWLRAVLYTLAQENFLVSAKLFVLFSSLSVFLVIYIANEVGGTFFGLATGLVFAVHQTFIEHIQSNFHPYYVPFFTLTAITLFLHSTRKKSLFYLAISWFFLFLSFHLHLSTLTLAPAFFISTLIFLYKDGHRFHEKKLLAFGFFITIEWCLYFFLTQLSIDNFIQWLHMLQTPATTGPTSTDAVTLYMKTVFLGMQIFTSGSVWSNVWPPYTLILTFILTATVMVAAVFIAVQSIRQKNIPKLFLSLCVLSASLVLLLKRFEPWYFVNQIELTFIFFTWCFYTVCTKVLGTQKNSRRVVFVCLLLLWFLPKTIDYFSIPVTGNYIPTQAISHQILDEVKQKTPNTSISEVARSIMLVDRINIDVMWGSSPYWYFLEKESNTQLTKVCSLPQNICPINQNPKYFFYICQKSEPDCITHIFSGYEPETVVWYSSLLYLPKSFLPPGKPRLIKKLSLPPEAAAQFQVIMATE